MGTVTDLKPQHRSLFYRYHVSAPPTAASDPIARTEHQLEEQLYNALCHFTIHQIVMNLPLFSRLSAQDVYTWTDLAYDVWAAENEGRAADYSHYVDLYCDHLRHLAVKVRKP